jgi:2-hydroxychromene-2-carboxylate isomerase
MPGEAATRALELLSPEGLGRSKELQAIAAWLGRDRESLKLTGASPLEAIGQAFTQQWEDLQRAKKEGGLAAAACRHLPLPAGAAAVDRRPLQVADERSS